MPLFIDLRDQTPTPYVWYRISDEYIPAADPHNGASVEYLPYLINLDDVRIAQQYIHGGLVKPEYGSLVVSPDTFAASWPPPVTLDCWISYVAPGTSPASVYGGDRIVMAKAVLAEWSGSQVRYDLHPPQYTDMIQDVTLSGTLSEVCAGYANSLTMMETVSVIGSVAYSGRLPAPPVHCKIDGESSILETLGEIAAFFSHRIAVDPVGGATMTEASQAVGTQVTLTSEDMVAISYLTGERYRTYEADYIQPHISNVELRFREASGCGILVLSGADVAATVNGALVKPAVQAVAVNRTNGGYPPYDPSQPAYPVSCLVDTDPYTIWATLGGYFPYADTVEEVRLQMAVGSGGIAEYALTSQPATPYCAPTQWDLYGWDTNRSEYKFLVSVDSPDWGSAEQRKFAVPVGTNWPVQLDGTNGATAVWKAPIVGNQADCGTIAEALSTIKALNDQERIRVSLPMGRGIIPHIGQQINFTDDTTPTATAGYLIVAAITFSAAEQIVVAEGPGVITR